MPAYLHDSVLLYLEKLVDWDDFYTRRKGDGADVAAERGALRTLLETCADICAKLEPDARAGWFEPARLENGEVIQPEHVRRGYEALREAGLVSVGVKERFGGFELPSFIANVLIQMVARADAALMTVIGLQAGVAEDIQKYAPEALQELYLPRFVSGELQGAMDLTEPQAGSDLGGITTRAVEENGRCFLDGQKIFITNGGAGIHLVLARDAETFEQSKGTTKGLSLFICPRVLPDGKKNAVFVERLEHKLGLHGSPTAVIRLTRAEAWRIGTKGDGFKAMLDLMNNARLGVAAQGIGIAEAAVEEAVRYSRERKQFGMPIGDQPLMKNMLSRMIVALEGSRALLYRVSTLIDHSNALRASLEREKAASASERAGLEHVLERNQIQIRLLTPLAKFLATESCDEITRAAIQVHGGIGFMAESSVGKLHLDGIVTTIYEGTSEIQVSFALKEIGKGALGIVFEELRKELGALASPVLAPFAARVIAGIERIEASSHALLSDFGYALLSARAVAEMVIAVIVASELLRQADHAPQRIELAARWIHVKMLELEAQARRVIEGDAGRIERCEKIVRLWA
ncbi:MAG TPA: acyl-CoA dehydrogenase family protein [Myxococcota bacterium]|nr:acyl-CoA dehydrogenase family protein [Myxococcota bacterium]